MLSDSLEVDFVLKTVENMVYPCINGQLSIAIKALTTRAAALSSAQRTAICDSPCHAGATVGIMPRRKVSSDI